MYCGKCGREVLDTENACPECGTPVAHNAAPVGEKSKLAAGLLGILLGGFGAHNFYLGYKGKAIAQLLITLLTCGFGAMITSVWGLIEGIMILTGSINTDANGDLLKD